jgi:hypothetical protein
MLYLLVFQESFHAVERPNRRHFPMPARGEHHATLEVIGSFVE